MLQLLIRISARLDAFAAYLRGLDYTVIDRKLEKGRVAFLVFLDRSRLALAAGLAFIALIGTIKLVSEPLYQSLYERELIGLYFVIPLAYFLLQKYRIS